MIIDCKKIARKILAELRIEILMQRAQGQRFGSIVCVKWRGCDIDFSVRLGMAANKLGLAFVSASCVEDVDTATACAEIQKFVRDENCGGIVVNRQMPAGVDVRCVLDAVPQTKDIDCAHDNNCGLVYDFPEAEFSPPAIGAARSVFKKLRLNSCTLEQKKVVLIGKGFTICRPIYLWLLGHVASLDIVDTSTGQDEKMALLKNVDIVICGATTDKVLVTGEMVRSGIVVLDYGAPTPNADAASIDAAGGIVTPNPGGMGPLVIAHLLKNYVILNSDMEE